MLLSVVLTVGGGYMAERAMGAEAAATATTQKAAVDLKNTKCMVMPDNDVTDGKTVTYAGVIYHFCCDDCIADFKKDPQKYITAMQKDPAKYGVAKK